MTTRTSAARSALVFSTADVAIPKRPTCKIQLGETVAMAKAPKVDVWRDVTRMLSKLDLARELADEPQPTADQTAELSNLLEDHELADLDAMEAAIITGVDIVDPDTGTVVAVQGGFLRQCLSKEDWRKVYLEWKDTDSDLDTEHLYLAARALQEEFADYFSNREQAVSLPKSPRVTKTTRKR